jgi:hypothetical protein
LRERSDTGVIEVPFTAQVIVRRPMDRLSSPEPRRRAAVTNADRLSWYGAAGSGNVSFHAPARVAAAENLRDPAWGELLCSSCHATGTLLADTSTSEGEIWGACDRLHDHAPQNHDLGVSQNAGTEAFAIEPGGVLLWEDGRGRGLANSPA